jgi:hypothetical protein
MKYSLIFSESLNFTRATLFEKWIRWLVLILLSMPIGYFLMVFIPRDLLQWGLTEKILFGLIFLISLALLSMLSGYTVRIFRGMKEPVDFDHPEIMFREGLRALFVMVLYLLPLIVLITLMIGINALLPAFAGRSQAIPALGNTNMVLTALVFILFIYTMLLLPVGLITFARSGKIRGGISFLKAQEFVDRIGWGNYLVAYFFLALLIIIFYITIATLFYLPYIGPVLYLCLLPVLLIFTFRYMTCVFESGIRRPERSVTPESIKKEADTKKKLVIIVCLSTAIMALVMATLTWDLVLIFLGMFMILFLYLKYRK